MVGQQCLKSFLVWSNEHHSQTRVHTHITYNRPEVGTQTGTTHLPTRARVVKTFERNRTLSQHEPMLSKRGRSSNTALLCENKTHAPTQPHAHKSIRAHARTRTHANARARIKYALDLHTSARTQTHADAHGREQGCTRARARTRTSPHTNVPRTKHALNLPTLPPRTRALSNRHSGATPLQ